jgi:hypothetical protein
MVKQPLLKALTRMETLAPSRLTIRLSPVKASLRAIKAGASCATSMMPSVCAAPSNFSKKSCLSFEVESASSFVNPAEVVEGLRRSLEPYRRRAGRLF